MPRLKIALIYNAEASEDPSHPGDLASQKDLMRLVRQLARALRSQGHTVSVLGAGHDLLKFQRRLRSLQPQVVFNQYEDNVIGASYEMRIAAMITMMGFPLTGSSALALGVTKSKYMCACLLVGAGVRIVPQTRLLETLRAVDQHPWEYPIIVRPAYEDSGLGLGPDSVVHSKKGLKERVRKVLQEFRQPVLAQGFLRGREFNVGLIGGTRPRVLPLAEVEYSRLPPHLLPIMSYAAKWIETSDEYRSISVRCPAEVEPELQTKIRDAALRAFVAVGAWGYARVDLRLDDHGEPCVLEVNCNPCLEAGLGLARSAAAAGISYEKLLDCIVRAAMERHRRDLTLFPAPAFLGSVPLPKQG